MQTHCACALTNDCRIFLLWSRERGSCTHCTAWAEGTVLSVLYVGGAIQYVGFHNHYNIGKPEDKLRIFILKINAVNFNYCKKYEAENWAILDSTRTLILSCTDTSPYILLYNKIYVTSWAMKSRSNMITVLR